MRQPETVYAAKWWRYSDRDGNVDDLVGLFWSLEDAMAACKAHNARAAVWPEMRPHLRMDADEPVAWENVTSSGASAESGEWSEGYSVTRETVR